MRLPIETKEAAIKLRKQGYSIKEISQKFNISKSTSSLWVRNVSLNKKAQKRLENRKLVGYYRAGITWANKRKEREKMELIKARKALEGINFRKSDLKLHCALLYWCEGTKGEKETVQFVNADPSLIQLFLFLFRKSFLLDEKKFRVALHLHDYHNEKKQKKFWAKLTKIPENQFYKIYWKPHTKKRIKEGYPGCARVIYHDLSIARELKAFYREFVNKFS